jgi:HlyD family secretion protein
MTRRWWLVGGGCALLAALLLVRALNRPAPAPATPAPQAVVTPPQPEAVSALGFLAPAGDVRKLAGPAASKGGGPRLSELLVQEGQRVQRGQVLATFDNRPRLQADLQAVTARIQSLEVQTRMQQREVARYERVAATGAAAVVLLEEKKDELVKLEGQLREARAQRQGVLVDLHDSQLRSPINGTVLRVLARVGERPGEAGIVEIGANDQMEAIAEVYESDIDRVKLGQSVRLVSENGGFDGSLQARVLRIAPQVRQRNVLSTDPTGDADARVVEVRLALDPADASKVHNLAGLKILARFQP